MKTKLQTIGIIILLIVLSIACADGAPSPNGVDIEWTVPVNAPAWVTNHVVWLGTNSPTGVNYYTNWVVSGTNGSISFTNLTANTNYVVIQANTQFGGTNAWIAPPSNFIRIMPQSVQTLRLSLMFRNVITDPWQEYMPLPDAMVVVTNNQQYYAVKGTISK